MKKLIIIVCVLFYGVGSAQQTDSTIAVLREQIAELKGALEGLNESFLETKTTVDALKKIKVSGYLQSQFQLAELDGIATYAGGNFPAGVHQRFQVRRGRVKFNYDNDLTQYVLQIDVTQNGVGIKDAYLSFRDPWLRTFGIAAGVFDRPFGFEISYSSGSRETPERSRMFQVLFPGERELGAKLEITPPEYSPLSFLNFRGGLFNGVLSNANEVDNNKDFIGRLGIQLPFTDINLALDAGISMYAGKVRSNSKDVYTSSESASNVILNSNTVNVGTYYERTYTGLDLQLYYDLPVIGGFSLRTEYISGKQPGTAASSGFYNPGSTITPLYLRSFNGFYVNYVQNIGVSHQVVLKYDVYDPNVDVEGTDIGASGKNLTAGDLRYTTLGVGWIYHWDANVKCVLYYDMVTNETVNSVATGSLATFMSDVKDNVLTVRLQYRF